MDGIPSEDYNEDEAFRNALERLGSKREPPHGLFEKMIHEIHELFPGLEDISKKYTREKEELDRSYGRMFREIRERIDGLKPIDRR